MAWALTFFGRLFIDPTNGTVRLSIHILSVFGILSQDNSHCHETGIKPFLFFCIKFVCNLVCEVICTTFPVVCSCQFSFLGAIYHFFYFWKIIDSIFLLKGMNQEGFIAQMAGLRHRPLNCL